MEQRSDSLEALDNLGQDVLSHAERAQRSLRLLRQIEDTISALCYERRLFEAMAKFVHEICEDIKHRKPVQPIDPHGTVWENLEKAQAAMKRLYETMVEKREYARNDPDLTEEDGVADEYTRSIAVVADLHNGINELRWAIGEHDAELEPKSGRGVSDRASLERQLDSL